MFSHVQRIYIVAGGPSLRDFDWSALDGKAVIAVNHAHLKLPKAQIVYFSDYRYCVANEETLRSHDGVKFSVVDPSRRQFPDWVNVLYMQNRFGLDLVPAHICPGNDSGYAAINLAVKLGAKDIHLMGYDFCYDENNNDHWHDPHPHGKVKLHTLKQKMMPYYRGLVQPLACLGVEVRNTNPNSYLTVFPFAKRIDK